MNFSKENSLIEQLRRLIRDTVDYLHSALGLLQARFTELALSGVVFVILLVFAGILGLASFVFLNIAFGVWLANLIGNTSLSITILGIFYAILAGILALVALRWLKTLRS